jgi:hypothetical protein
MQDDVSLKESRRRPFATLPWFEALANSVVHRRLLTVLSPQTALTDMQETSSAITKERKLSLDTSILT